MGTLRDLQFALQLKVEELRQRDTLIDELELELDTKDELIRRLQGELDRHRATVSLPGPTPGCSAQGEYREKRKTIISEPFTVDHKILAGISQSHAVCDKSPESQKLIQASFLKSVFLKNLTGEQTRALLDCIHSTTVSQGCCVIQEGSIGAHAYILDDGKLEMTKDGQKPVAIEPGNMFGELALLYDSTSLCNVSALTECKLWVIERRSFQAVLMQTYLSTLSLSMKHLSSIPFLQALPEDVIVSMSDVMEETSYTESDYIIRQGDTGDTFYVISQGQVKVTEKKHGFEEPVVLCRLSEGQWFGEKALWGHDVRTVNVIAAGNVTCLVIGREAFKNIIGVLADGNNDMQRSNKSSENATLLSNTTLSDFQIISNLGEDELGHTDLVQLKSNTKCSFAMRVLSKRLIVSSCQQEHILRERDILMEANSPFIVRLHQTFRDTKHLYMLTEVCAGGDLWSVLKERESFGDCSTRFYTACVVEALIFLHHSGIIYRDLKPENVLMDHHGYVKLMGPGCSKKIGVGKKTWTFCGTPGYMAPEIILNKGHSVSTDLWSLGIFMFELLTGSLPFSGSDPMNIFAATIHGIDQVNFPKAISKSASSLIKKLCRNNPCERLGSRRNGAKDIQKHKWFEGFNWEGLCKGTLSPPVTPKFNQSMESGTRPGHYNEDVEGLPELETNWDKDF